MFQRQKYFYFIACRVIIHVLSAFFSEAYFQEYYQIVKTVPIQIKLDIFFRHVQGPKLFVDDTRWQRV